MTVKIALPEETGLVTVDGKQYVIGRHLQVGLPYQQSAPAVFINYWSTRDGQAFGPVRFANSLHSKSSSVGGKLVAAALTAAGISLDEALAQYVAA